MERHVNAIIHSSSSSFPPFRWVGLVPGQYFDITLRRAVKVQRVKKAVSPMVTEYLFESVPMCENRYYIKRRRRMGGRMTREK